MSFFSFLESIPSISSVVLKYYTEGPPKKSWDLRFHLAIAMIKDGLASKLSIEQIQEGFDTYFKFKTYPNITIKDVILDDEYRQKSKAHLEKILKQYVDVLDEKWKDPNDKGLHGEWQYINEKTSETDNVILYLHGGGFCIGSPKYVRLITIKFVKFADCRVFSLNYRLSPQNQFPAALCDSIAAYLYLTNPGPNAGFEPINPKRIILAGENAGGNLVFSTLLFLRDAGLPLPAGAIALSPWVDLTQSMPSKWDSEIDKIDFVPSELGYFTNVPSSPAMDEFYANTKVLADKIALKNPKIVSHPSFTEVPRFNLYCVNEALAIPYVSPMLAESLGNLPPILCQVGGDEKFRDETVLICHKASSPHEYQLPSYATKNFEKSPFKKPTNVILEVYDDMPHVFHMFTFSKPSQVAVKRCCDFIKRVSSIEDNNTSMIDIINEDIVSSSISVSSSFTAIRVGTDGMIRELNETDRDCLKWNEIGVVPKSNL
ncbi:2726_t:CDS:2 [Cetraspora pellucida]|uniref:2726_t:CDS:1 n=1 Tax=Cetraspora pellucida TaxID=1433469 RepID=A0ACA9KN37_9GLOM|nr:2726_t:CDS:2 [Cetraspora pellucida]